LKKSKINPYDLIKTKFFKYKVRKEPPFTCYRAVTTSCLVIANVTSATW